MKTNLQNFERFTNIRQHSKTPSISFWSRGQIAFNRAFAKKYIKEKQYAILFFNRKSKQVGVRFINEQEEGTLMIGGNQSGTRWITCRTFFSTYQIKTPRKFLNEPEYNQSNDLFIIQL